MAIISGGRVIEGSVGPLLSAGVPGAGTNAVQTATLGGTGGTSTFKLVFEGVRTAAIAWSATNGTLLANINAALDAAFGAAQIVASDSTLASGLGNLLLTFSGSNNSKRVQSLMTASIVTGALTVAIATTTPGVDAFGRGCSIGCEAIDITNGKQYTNSGTPNAPTWTVTGAQS